jgi:hypothetical protein
MVLLTSLLVMITGCNSGPVRHKPPTLTLACSTRTDPGRLSAAPAPRPVSLPGHPFAAVALPGGRWAVASLTVAAFPGDLGELAVLAVHGQAASLARRVRLPWTVSGADGMALTRTGAGCSSRRRQARRCSVWLR